MDYFWGYTPFVLFVSGCVAGAVSLIRVAMSELNLSARAYDRILKVSRAEDLPGQRLARSVRCCV
jgi:Magnesium chelatase, subunit ChlI C-terminal